MLNISLEFIKVEFDFYLERYLERFYFVER